MPELTAVSRLNRRGLIDTALAVSVAVPGLVAILLASPRAVDLVTAVALLFCAGSMVARHRFPVLAGASVAAMTVAAVQAGGLNPKLSNPVVDIASTTILLTCLLLAFNLGGAERIRTSLLGLAALVVATQWQQFSPFPAVMLLGLWVVGRVLSSRRHLTEDLQARGTELEEERGRYAVEAVRYERARIARELHDIIAHCMSVVVIQAAAGRRANTSELSGTDAVFATITELARQAESDILALTRLLSADDALAQPLSRDVIDQLVAHATATGTAIDVVIGGDLDRIPPTASQSLHRVLQEGLTNAFKHAPGAAISVSIDCDERMTRLEIRNQPPVAAPLLEGQSGGNGVRGLAERVSAVAGSLCAGPTLSGGWNLTATVPTRPKPSFERGTLS